MIAIPQFREAISSFKVDSLPSYEYMSELSRLLTDLAIDVP